MADTTCEMDTLGDDELLLILQYVGPEDLLRCRAVCRRLKDLALLPELWRWRRVVWWGNQNLMLPPERSPLRVCAMAPAIVRLAPCLDQLVLRSLRFMSSHELKCAVAKLSLDIYSNRVDGSDCWHADVISSQMLLGCLEELSVTFLSSVTKRVVNDVVYEILCAKDLKVLDVTMDDVELCTNQAANEDAADEHKFKPSLTRLAYSSQTIDPFLKLLLATHAMTLEEVELKIRNPYLGDFGRDLVDFLIEAPNLKKLTCPLLHGLHRLPQTKTLTSLALSSEALEYLLVDGLEKTEQLLLSAEQLLRTATQLSHLRISTPSNNLSLLRALVASEPSRISSFQLKIVYHGRHPQLYETLASALEKMHSLQSLTLDVTGNVRFLEINKVMMVLRPETTPCLSHLAISSMGCLHFLLKKKSVHDMLKANTLQMTCLNDVFCFLGSCQLGCHQIRTDKVTWESVRGLTKLMSNIEDDY